MILEHFQCVFVGKMGLPQKSLVMTFAVNMLQQEKLTAKVTSSDFCGKHEMIIFISIVL